MCYSAWNVSVGNIVEVVFTWYAAIQEYEFLGEVLDGGILHVIEKIKGLRLRLLNFRRFLKVT